MSFKGSGRAGTHNYNIKDKAGDGFRLNYPQASGGQLNANHPLVKSGRIKLPTKNKSGNISPGSINVPSASGGPSPANGSRLEQAHQGSESSGGFSCSPTDNGCSQQWQAL